MILAFHPQFIQPILSGIKIHTFREDKNDRWRPGKIIHGATGVRTSKYNQFFESKCISIQYIDIIIGRDTSIDVFLDDYQFNDVEIENFWKNDGFISEDDFLKWFTKNSYGKIIHWTDFKY